PPDPDPALLGGESAAEHYPPKPMKRSTPRRREVDHAAVRWGVPLLAAFSRRTSCNAYALGRQVPMDPSVSQQGSSAGADTDQAASRALVGDPQKAADPFAANERASIQGVLLQVRDLVLEVRDLLVSQRQVRDYYSTEQAAQILGKSDWTVREWCRL